MTREEFFGEFRGRMMLFVTEAWSVRKLVPSQLGLEMDRHAIEMRRLLNEMYDALAPPADTPKPTANGHAANGRR